MAQNNSERESRCLLCGKSKEDVRILVAGREGMICDECIALAARLVMMQASPGGAIYPVDDEMPSETARRRNECDQAPETGPDDVNGDPAETVSERPKLTLVSSGDGPKGCTCGWLQGMAEDPDMPVEYDCQTNEFHFVYVSKHDGMPGQLSIYHCPFCGRAAPKSKRDQLFAVITAAEAQRLNILLADVETFDDASVKFGAPDHDFPNGHTSFTPEKDGSPPTAQSYRSVLYERLSETVDVYLTDFRRDRVDIQFQGKFLGQRSEGKPV